MTKKPQKYLFDIQTFCHRVGEYMQSIEDFESYKQNHAVKDAVERNIEKIAEAMKKLKDLFHIELPSCDRAYNFRGSLIHQYDEIKDRTVYHFVMNDIPAITSEVNTFLAEE